MKIKVFEFEVSNESSILIESEKNKLWYKKSQQRLKRPIDIENEINEFIKDKSVIDIKINEVDVYYNNTRCNTIHLIYTIIYQ